MSNTWRQTIGVVWMIAFLWLLILVAIPSAYEMYQAEQIRVTDYTIAEGFKNGLNLYGLKVKPSLDWIVLNLWWLALPVIFFIGSIFFVPRKLSAVVACFGWSCLLWYIIAPFLKIFLPDFYYSNTFLDICIVLGIVTIAVFIVRYVAVPVLWPRLIAYDVGGITLDDLSPEKGKTVAEIKKGFKCHSRQFLFGKADGELVEKWGVIAKTIQTLTKTRKRQVMTIIFCLILWPVLVFFGSGGSRGEFDRDVNRMWQTQQNDKGLLVSTPIAMNAAKRVFNDSSGFLIGLTKDEALKVLKIEKLQPTYIFCKPRYDFEANETIMSLSDGKNTRILLAGFDTDKKISRLWSESGLTLLSRYLKKNTEKQ